MSKRNLNIVRLSVCLQGMRATRVDVDNMETRLYIHRNFPMESMSSGGLAVTGLEHLVSREEVVVRRDLSKIEQYQQWIDEQQDLADAIVSMTEAIKEEEITDVPQTVEEQEAENARFVNSFLTLD